MPHNIETFELLKRVLNTDDLDELKRASQAHLAAENPIPSFVLLDRLDSPVVRKISSAIEQAVGAKPYYLNDFYFYSDNAFGAHWHVDTELFTFDDCLNAWILLSPDEIVNPLAFIGDLNGAPDRYFHSLKAEGDQGTFLNYRNGKKEARALADIEATRLDTPEIKLGDILLLNPKKFHKTNTTVPKHAIVIKYAFEGKNGFLSPTQVPSMFWSEVGMFNSMLKGTADWEDFLAAVRLKLKTPDGRKALSAGFFPEKIGLYQKMVATL